MKVKSYVKRSELARKKRTFSSKYHGHSNDGHSDSFGKEDPTGKSYLHDKKENEESVNEVSFVSNSDEKHKKENSLICADISQKPETDDCTVSRAVSRENTSFAKLSNPIISSFIEKQLKQPWYKNDSFQTLRSKKMFALAVHSKYPDTYGFFRDVFSLPSVGVLGQWKQKISFRDRLWQLDLLSVIEKRVSSMNEEDKLCGIECYVQKLDITGIKVKTRSSAKKIRNKNVHRFKGESNKYALVLMVKGLCKNWQYICGFHLVEISLESNHLKLLLVESVGKLQGIGLTVKFLSSTPGPNCHCIKDKLNITLNQPYFTVENEKIYLFFDANFLMAYTLRTFRKNDICVRDGLAKWDYVLAFLQKDSEQNLKLCPHVDDTVLKTLCEEEVSCNLDDATVKVLNQAVSMGISILVTSGILPRDAECTAQFIFILSKLCECFVGTKEISNDSRISSSVDMKILENMMSVIKGWKFASDVDEDGFSCNTSLSCLLDWQINVNSLLHLWKELQDHYSVSHINVQRPCQNWLGNSLLTLNNGLNNAKLSLTEFEIILRKLVSRSFKQISLSEDFQSYAS